MKRGGDRVIATVGEGNAIGTGRNEWEQRMATTEQLL